MTQDAQGSHRDVVVTAAGSDSGVASQTELGPMPAELVAAFPEAMSDLQAYAQLLATEGIVRGLIGPREVPRLWERHIGNCALVEGVIPESVQVADIGSGAGLPGLVLALIRPDLHITLIEPLLRRATFLDEAVTELGLSERVTVLRARAQEVARSVSVDVVTARAVAPLADLLTWGWPLLKPGGHLALLKGTTVESERDQAAGELSRRGVALEDIRIERIARAGSEATVVVIPRAATPR